MFLLHGVSFSSFKISTSYLMQCARGGGEPDVPTTPVRAMCGSAMHEATTWQNYRCAGQRACMTDRRGGSAGLLISEQMLCYEFMSTETLCTRTRWGWCIIARSIPVEDYSQ